MKELTMREYYMSEYPTDDLGAEIAENATFDDLFEALDFNQDVYKVIGVGDSVIRERLFSKLAEIMGVNYDYVYRQWVSG